MAMNNSKKIVAGGVIVVLVAIALVMNFSGSKPKIAPGPAAPTARLTGTSPADDGDIGEEELASGAAEATDEPSGRLGAPPSEAVADDDQPGSASPDKKAPRKTGRKPRNKATAANEQEPVEVGEEATARPPSAMQGDS